MSVYTQVRRVPGRKQKRRDSRPGHRNTRQRAFGYKSREPCPCVHWYRGANTNTIVQEILCGAIAYLIPIGKSLPLLLQGDKTSAT